MATPVPSSELKQNLEHLTLLECTSLLARGISLNPLEIAQKCLEQHLVSTSLIDSVLNQTKDDHAKASELVNKITTRVQDFPEKFYVFMRILHQLPYLNDVHKKVLEKYEEKGKKCFENTSEVDCREGVNPVKLLQEIDSSGVNPPSAKDTKPLQMDAMNVQLSELASKSEVKDIGESGNASQKEQQGVEHGQLDYYDIMVIGKTGIGKSTTVDKMIIAKLRDVREERSSTILPLYDAASHKLECEDLAIWMVSDSQQSCYDNDYEMMGLRLKNLIFFQSLKNSHLEINRSRDTNINIYGSTLECELLSNECTKIRVLDVPGFFRRVAAGDEETLLQRTQACAESTLSSMRKVLRIMNTHNLKFRRVVYFLPEHGVLNRTSQSLIVELQIMEKHFGRAIFDSMVVIATVPSVVYKHIQDDDVLFANEEFEQTKHHLQETLEIVFKGIDVPEPPIEFISLLDTCEDVLYKVQSAKVLKDKLILQFRSSYICARCGAKIIKEDGQPAYCEYPNSKIVIPYEESTCHPMMIPKHPRLKKFVDGLQVMLNFFGKKEMIETNDDEVCIKCGNPPFTRGCMGIRALYPGAKDGIVNHSSSAEETYHNIEIEGLAEEVVAVSQI